MRSGWAPVNRDCGWGRLVLVGCNEKSPIQHDTQTNVHTRCADREFFFSVNLELQFREHISKDLFSFFYNIRGHFEHFSHIYKNNENNIFVNGTTKKEDYALCLKTMFVVKKCQHKIDFVLYPLASSDRYLMRFNSVLLVKMLLLLNTMSFHIVIFRDAQHSTSVPHNLMPPKKCTSSSLAFLCSCITHTFKYRGRDVMMHATAMRSMRSRCGFMRFIV